MCGEYSGLNALSLHKPIDYDLFSKLVKNWGKAIGYTSRKAIV
jgi:hypothetical protein